MPEHTGASVWSPEWHELVLYGGGVILLAVRRVLSARNERLILLMKLMGGLMHLVQ